MGEYGSLYELLEAFPTEAACVEHLANLRWPRGVICPLCGSSRKIYNVKRSHGFKCGDCDKGFSVRKGTIFEESRLPLRKWFAAAWLMTSHRKGIPSTQIAREIGVTQKTAWFMLGRLREVAAQMVDTGGPVAGEVEADETFMGGKNRNRHRSKRIEGRGIVGKQPVIGAVERGGRVKARMVDDTSMAEVHGFVRANVAPGSTLYTDEHRAYLGLSDYDHHSVNHGVGEYVRGMAHTNGIESFWSLLKRGYVGVFHHFSWKHLHRYLDEFASRWNLAGMDGGARLNALLGSASGLRLTYRELIR